MRKDAGGSSSRNGTGALSKEMNHTFAQRFIESRLNAKYS